MTFKARLIDIARYADDVFKLRFSAEPKYTRFKPGQFLHFTLDYFDPTEAYWPESRVFSICSVPRSGELCIFYSVKGSYTERMRKELTVGNEYWIKLPFGDFIIEEFLGPADTAVLVAGGTGVSPYVPYLNLFMSGSIDRPVYLAYAVRSPDRLVFADLLQRLKHHPTATSRVWCENSPEPQNLITDTGVLDLSAVLSDTAKLPEPHYFLSGPPGMLTSFSERIQAAGIRKQNIHVDKWE